MNTPDLVSLQARVRRALAEPTHAALRTSDEFTNMTTVSLPCTSQARRGPLASATLAVSCVRLPVCWARRAGTESDDASCCDARSTRSRRRARHGASAPARASLSRAAVHRGTRPPRCSGHDSARLFADHPPHCRVWRCSRAVAAEARAGTRFPPPRPSTARRPRSLTLAATDSRCARISDLRGPSTTEGARPVTLS